MALDDVIKSTKQSTRGSSRGRGRSALSRTRGGAAGAFAVDGNGSSAGPIRRGAPRSTSRPSPYTFAKPAQRATDGPWQHDLFEDDTSAAPGRPTMGIETGTKLYISNLDYGVSNEDIKELFSEVGDLKRGTIHFDRSGRSKGTAEVVYSRRTDALAAMKRYNNVQLDGKPMKIELIGTNLSIPAPAARVSNGTATAGRGGRGAGVTAPRGRGVPGRRGRGQGRGRVGGAEKSAAELDAELEDYHSEAMQIS